MSGSLLTDGPVPKREQLIAVLRRTAAEDLGPDQPVPSERELVERHGVSRQTVREAIGHLVHEGVLYRVHGKGTYVAARQVQTQLHLASFTDDMRRRGLAPSTRVLRAEAAEPPAEVAAALDLPSGPGSAWRVERLRLADGVPMALEESWFPAHLLPRFLEHDLTGSLYTLLGREYGLSPSSGDQVLTAEAATRAQAELMRTSAGAALLVFTRTTSAGDVVVERTTSRYRADRYSVRTTLDRTPPR
ncbi:GntR family transcriptional regulator [Streptomyces sp. NP160]|uniref:GntR family transcriptional regulator n=1 Tax=Streptomyces sp. NP160 TaxID=2586637 RepID=UPI0011186EF0|nr:GntR family transcriptional regulator [Streptomyces sp. NP160]TNM59556.1 GntR family transcriptional regulator [Streptomyces sp. NP160]